jgi:fucose 4-O-acetylase-like acetyltransferase
MPTKFNKKGVFMEKMNRNQTFQWLEALAILMVLDDHMSTRIGILSSIFPYNSFYMPMFVFISGYFYRDKPVIQTIRHKVRHLLFPYLIWAFVGEIISYLLMRFNIVNWFVNPFSIIRVKQLFLIDSLSSITGASWFVIMLFWVSIGYGILNSILQLGKKNNDYIWLLLSIIIGFISLKFCITGYNTSSLRLFLLRTAWYLQFYHMGRMFHCYWEKYIINKRLLYICSACVGINVLLICVMGDRINFYSTGGMGHFNSWWIPLITSITETLFWYKVMQLAASKIGQEPIIDFIAENTFTIMECHLVFLNIPNFYAYYQFLHGNPVYADFPMKIFIHGAWLRYSPNTRLLGWFCGLLGSLIVAYLLRRLKVFIHVRATSIKVK